MKWCPMLRIGFLLAVPLPASAQSPTALEPTSSAPQPDASCVQRLRKIGDKCKIAVLSDAIKGEENPVRKAHWHPDVAPDLLLSELAKESERDVIKIEDLCVLRHKRWVSLQRLAAFPLLSQFPQAC